MRLDDVLRGDLCAGCGLCSSILGPERARMAMSETGFLRPEVLETPTQAEDVLVDAVCPGGRLDQEVNRRSHPVWGPILELYTGHATDDEMRFTGSSGGALSALLQHLLDTGQADYVLHVGANEQRPWLTQVEVSTDRDQVVAGAGSRYAASAPLADVVQRLRLPGRFVFVGKPCDVAGLRMYARRDPVVDQKVVAMITFMCAGVPSEEGALTLLERMGVSPTDVASFWFRGRGWPGRATAILKSGEERSLSYAETWGDVLSKHVQRRCKICPDGMGVFADVVCADAWYSDAEGNPSFEEREGRSLVMARTAKGAALVSAAAESCKLYLEPLDVTELEKMQPHQARRTRLTLSRITAMALLRRRFPRYRGLSLGRAAWQAGVLANIKSVLGTVRRMVRRRL